MTPPKESSCLAEGATAAPGQTALPKCGQVWVKGDAQSATHLGGFSLSMADLSRMLSTTMGRNVIDKTGFTGRFDLYLPFTPDRSAPGLGKPGLPACRRMTPAAHRSLPRYSSSV